MLFGICLFVTLGNLKYIMKEKNKTSKKIHLQSPYTATTGLNIFLCNNLL